MLPPEPPQVRLVQALHADGDAVNPGIAIARKTAGLDARRVGFQSDLEVVRGRKKGARAGDEVVQLYVAHEGSAVERPSEELKGFQRIALRPGEIRTVTLPLAAKNLAYWQESSKSFVVEPDTVNVMVGGSSDNLPLHVALKVVR